MEKTGRIIVITGASSGIGMACAQKFSKQGNKVYNLSRSEQLPTAEQANTITFIKTDVTNDEDIKSAFRTIFQKEGCIDVLINNAGFGISGSAEGATKADIEKLLAVNFVGVARCCSEVLPYMREQKRGKIINISSLAAAYPLPFQSFYSASKAAVSAYTTALRTELNNLSITACAVMLGDVKTGFTASREKNVSDLPVYNERLKRAIDTYEHDEQSRGATPETIAQSIYKISQKKNPNAVITVGFKSKLLIFVTRLLPTRFINWIVANKY
jgi:short-subunit dehydrogenase